LEENVKRTLVLLVAAGLGAVGIGASAIASAGSAGAPPTSTGAAAPALAPVGSPIGISGGWPGHDVVKAGETFLKATFSNVSFSGQTVTLSSHADGTGSIAVDDVLVIQVKRPDGSKAKYQHDFSNGCAGQIFPIAPVNITNLFAAGLNKVTVTMKDKCGGTEGNDPLYLNY
jgi:hypothetical protein